ncbi:hypothetical protein HMF7854_12600 [Sphingomonas ginkgonis]|uniref:Uncharacterized protein n=1 Tax=Sphingomonas ginkgonis TaxID=2315330 RepID=A0A429VC72_9SPHN|nr:hypothetical protein [Sphingomonas ginkgonis]RST31580.1 hypothetical protein HMF7854_12600 [Sphingomonas ginkgonis]
MNDGEAGYAKTDTVGRYDRFFSILYLAGIAAVAALFVANTHIGEHYVPPQPFAGCYETDGISPLELTPSGILRSAQTDVGRFKVVAPVGGKHGTLIEATAVDVVERRGRAFFVKGAGGFLWPINGATLNVTYAPDGQMQLARRPMAACN